MFAYQYITRPGNGYGGYYVNTGEQCVFIPCTTASDRARLYRWVGKGDAAKGRDMVNASISMPDVSLNPAQYNAMVASFDDYTKVAFVDKGNR